MWTPAIRAHRSALIALAVVPLTAFHSDRARGPAAVPPARWNDNREPAGTLRDGVLRLRLEARRVTWHVLGDDQPGGAALAFAEEGRDPMIPGPLIRVPRGTTVQVSVRNPLDTVLVVRGFSSRRTAPGDSLVVPPGAVREVAFVADAEGTYYYVGSTTGQGWGAEREDSPLVGALIVDPAGAVGPARDRVLVMTIWAAGRDSAGRPDGSQEFLTINGRPWPLTERLGYQMGDSVRWRLINATARPHPMHLHGFFYRVTAKGDAARDTLYWPAQQRLAVTELMRGGSTLDLAWHADRPGYWIFHCHLNFHVLPNAGLGPDRPTEEELEDQILHGHHEDPDQHAVRGMGGLVMGIEIHPPAGWTPHEPKRRQLRLFIDTDSGPADTLPRFAYVLQEDSREPAPDSLRLPGTPIVVYRGEPTAVTVINRTHEATQVHWHGLEIESYYDGVAGGSGHPGRMTPAILPGDSFEMRITPPRAGSFMYHTHINDIRQQANGLYGPFLVLEPGERWQPETDRVVMLSYAIGAGVLVNGRQTLDATTMQVGTAYRLRLMNITVFSSGLQVLLTRNGYPEQWRIIAMDGADVPPGRSDLEPAQATVTIGKTMDVEFLPRAPGDLQLEVRTAAGRLLVSQAIHVALSGP